MWRDALLVAGKDLRIELRSKVAVNQVLPFAVVTVLLFGLAIGQGSTTGMPGSNAAGAAIESGLVNSGTLRSSAAGLFWVAVLFSTVLGVQRSFAVESADSARDGLRLSGLDPAGIFIGKAVALALQLWILEAVLAVASAFLFGVHYAGWILMFGTCLGATLGLVAVGMVYGMLSSGASHRETLLPLLFFPVVTPVLLAATKAWDYAIAGHSSSGTGWMEVLAGFAFAYLAIGSVAFGPLLEDQ